MLIVLSGGGTAGHINPALALAETLQDRGCDVRFAGTPKGVEARLVPEAGIPFQPFEASGFNRNHPTTLPKALIKISKSTGLAKAWLSDIKPDCVVGFGGYVSIPVGRAAEKLGIPLVLHEQNSVMGLANKQLSRKASKVCLTYACSNPGLPENKVEVTGNPVRKQVLEATRDQGREMLGIPDEARMLLVFGGSLGARHINQAICAMKDELLERPDLYVVHITGPKELESVQEALALTDDEAKRYIVMGYQNRMGETLAAADCIVSRSGATSLAEISARAIPALLVPFPYATADHQTTNAKAYVEAGCAYLIADDQAESEEFKQYVRSLIDDASVRESMHAAALAQKTASASSRLADAVLSIASLSAVK
ncbi:MAG: undecaprenyldiphospho-muramoylpentapeptide beta-N-acetylglucosaminyltransferase [Eggerthellaceae bacterium]|nr:undecaprenyldiphospho-muramoylpentapeptide beta-N-acetylglucosaminyltransferase [Eggerthellaceae bacterium]